MTSTDFTMRAALRLNAATLYLFPPIHVPAGIRRTRSLGLTHAPREGASWSPQNLASVEIGKDFMLSHGYIKNDFDVRKWAAPELIEEAARILLKECWRKETTAKLPDTTELLSDGPQYPAGAPRLT